MPLLQRGGVLRGVAPCTTHTSSLLFAPAAQTPESMPALELSLPYRVEFGQVIKVGCLGRGRAGQAGCAGLVHVLVAVPVVRKRPPCPWALHAAAAVHTQVVGSGPAFGDWSTDDALLLKWSEGDVWRGQLRMPPGAYEFKVRSHAGAQLQLSACD